MPQMISLLEEAAPDAANNDINSNDIAREHVEKARSHGHGYHESNHRPYSTALKNVAVTVERQLYIPQPGDKLVDPGTARVNIAASKEQPDGTPGWAEEHKHQTVLQQHCAYWDSD
ncbi:hypothetical protein HII31_04762 [Pseudocercospora fuligena]|uniref:Uncharacterized protein n=1 Tax=Pseudocercospora fuligena TaxID=685502 RepID=A0A8H6VKN3_9PEZI|nr:hypothetical protein HII31_04762 [Pseudocercospora fuligena]